MIPNCVTPPGVDASVGAELLSNEPVAKGVATQTYLTWAEWPDQQHTPSELGWGRVPLVSSSPGGESASHVNPVYQGMAKSHECERATQTEMHWDWHPCYGALPGHGGDGFWHGSPPEVRSCPQAEGIQVARTLGSGTDPPAIGSSPTYSAEEAVGSYPIVSKMHGAGGGDLVQQFAEMSSSSSQSPGDLPEVHIRGCQGTGTWF